MDHRDLIQENAWMFEQQPSAEQITPLLETVPAWHGSTKTMADYQGFVISISQTMGKNEARKTVWRLYTTVAGKISILHDAHRMEDGTVIPITEDPKVDYKNSLAVVYGTMSSPIFGTVAEVGTGVMGDGASGADRTNPLENAFTSWRGRAASALCGAGILPYTGIASAEEVQTAQHRDAMADAGFRVTTPDTHPAQSSQASDPKQNRVLKPFTSVKETLKREKGWTEDTAEERVAQFLSDNSIALSGTAVDTLTSQPNGIELVGKLLKWGREN